LLSAPKRHTLLYGGARSGKTVLFVRAIMMRAIHAPESRHAMLRLRANAARASLWLDTLPKVQRVFFPKFTLRDHRQDGYVEIVESGSQIWIAGTDDKERIEKILGQEFLTIYLNECSQIPYSTVLTVLTRLAQTHPEVMQKAFYDLNPVGTRHYTSMLFVQGRDPLTQIPILDAHQRQYSFINPKDNRAFLTEEFLQSLQAMPDRQRRRFYEGIYQAEIDGALWTFDTIQRHRLLAVAVPVILPAEPDLAVVHGQQPVVGDGDTVGVASDIVEDLGWPGERPLRVDHPLGVPNWRQMPPERGWFMKVAVRGEELQLTGGEGLFQIVQEQASKHPREHCDRQEEPRPAGYPAFTVQRDPAARKKKVNVRVVQQILSPGVQHTQEADLRAQMVWIGGDLTQRLRRRSEQDIVDDGLVLEGDDLDLRGHREHDVEVGHVEQFGLTVREPLGARETLALWATFVAARVVRDALMATIAARLDVTAKSGGAATLDREHGAPPRGGQRRAFLITESGAEVAEHVRHL